MRICILEADHPPPELIKTFGDYGTMFVDWLSPALPEAHFSILPVHAGAPLPQPQEFDGYLLTGSRHGVYDALPWMSPIVDLLRALRDHRLPVGGICFGHQIMAKAYGGKVEKSSRGWVIGPQEYGDCATALAFHQDQVMSLPTGVSSYTGNEECQFGRIEYEFSALSVQYHPEFSSEYVTALLDHYGGNRIPQDIAQRARPQLKRRLDRSKLAHDFAQALRQ